MKKLFIAIPLFYILLIAFCLWQKDSFHKRNMDMGEHAFNYGCYSEAQNVAAHVDDENARLSVLQDAFDNCPKWGKNFRTYLEKGIPR